MKKIIICCTLFLGLLLCAVHASFAHFGMIIPSRSTVIHKNQAKIDLLLAFGHPMEHSAMNMEKPRIFEVMHDGVVTDLLPSLTPKDYLSHKAWESTYTLTKPGVYQFYFAPIPYFEPAEDCFIVHHTKTYVAAFGEEDGWDEPLHVETEIVPISRPFGLFAGSVFQGKVLADGKALANVTVEVEYLNSKNTLKASDEYFVTQVVKTDERGIFTVSLPWEGMWGISAIHTAAKTMEYKGEAKSVEMGAVLWIECKKPVKTN